MSGWVRSNNDAGIVSLEALRRSDVVVATYSPEYDCPVAIARSKGGKERLLCAWSDALNTGIATIADLFKTGVGVDMRSVGVWF